MQKIIRKKDMGWKQWNLRIVGVRLTDGLNGTIVDRPSSPAILIYTRSETIFILRGAAFFAAWMANGCFRIIRLTSFYWLTFF